MDESEAKLEKVGESAGEEVDGIEYVDDLIDATDYWLTLTDAARVTRRQEVTIRRWVTGGALPVRRQRMGMNRRTRHVRASDLARITPIVDPTAAITGAPANADLLSIPVQQARIMTDHQELLQQLARVNQALALFDRAMVNLQTEQHAALEHVRLDLLSQMQQRHQEQEHAVTAQFELVRRHQTAQELRLSQVDAAFVAEKTQRQTTMALLTAQIDEAQQMTTSLQECSRQQGIHVEENRAASEQHYHDLFQAIQQLQEMHDQRITKLATDTMQHIEALRDALRQLAANQQRQDQELRELTASMHEHQTTQQAWNQHAEKLIAGLRRRHQRRR